MKALSVRRWLVAAAMVAAASLAGGTRASGGTAGAFIIRDYPPLSFLQIDSLSQATGTKHVGSGRMVLADASSVPVSVTRKDSPRTGRSLYTFRTARGTLPSVKGKVRTWGSPESVYKASLAVVLHSGERVVVKDASAFSAVSPAGGTATPVPVLEQGDFWEFYWSRVDDSYAQGSGGETTRSGGAYRVVLGPGTGVGGRTAFPVTVVGRGGSAQHPVPRWTHLASDGGRLLGSQDGATLQVIADLRSGVWKGGGFFTEFPADTTLRLSQGVLSNEFVETPALLAFREEGQSACQYFPGYGTICSGDSEWSISQEEFYKAGIGPLGYHFKVSYSSSGGGFYTSSTTTVDIALVASSLTAADGFVPKLPPVAIRAAMNHPRVQCLAAAAGGRVYVLGGDAGGTMEEYDPATDTWRDRTAPPPAGNSGGPSFLASAGGSLHLFSTGSALSGGILQPVIHVQAYDPALDSWTEKSISLYDPFNGRDVRADLGTSMGSRIFFLSGPRPYYAYSYDPAVAPDGAWYVESLGPHTMFPEYSGQIAATDTKVCVIGWAPSVGTNYFSLAVYDIATGSSEGHITGPMRRYQAVGAIGSEVYVSGGFFYGKQREVTRWDLEALSDSVVGSLVVARSGHACVELDGRLYFLGGEGEDGEPLSAVEEYDPAR